MDRHQTGTKADRQTDIKADGLTDMIMQTFINKDRQIDRRQIGEQTDRDFYIHTISFVG